MIAHEKQRPGLYRREKPFNQAAYARHGTTDRVGRPRRASRRRYQNARRTQAQKAIQAARQVLFGLKRLHRMTNLATQAR